MGTNHVPGPNEWLQAFEEGEVRGRQQIEELFIRKCDPVLQQSDPVSGQLPTRVLMPAALLCTTYPAPPPKVVSRLPGGGAVNMVMEESPQPGGASRAVNIRNINNGRNLP